MTFNSDGSRRPGSSERPGASERLDAIGLTGPEPLQGACQHPDVDDQSDADRQLDAVAVAILEETRSAVLTALRFMGPALYAMPFVRTQLHRGALATNGICLGYDARGVVCAFRDDPNELLRDYLHIILHCVYRHPFDEKHPRWSWWDIACDIAVGATALELVGRRFPCADDGKRADALLELRNRCSVLTAPKLYRAIAATRGAVEGAAGESADAREASLPRSQPPIAAGSQGRERTPDTLPNELITQLTALFISDNHSSWPRHELQDDLLDAGDGELPEWDDISKLIETGLEDYRNRPSFETDALVMNLKVVNRKKSDYRQFLKRFASISEEVKPNPEEFDYIYYTYGLSLYDNMPLVEPLEYHESIRVREFVIAIDTSASCSGDLVRHFVEQTYSILKSTGGFGGDMNVHIIQSDSEIRDVIKVKEAKDLDEYFANFEMRGFGDTDFRPVFEYVDEAIKNNEFKNLKGIVYLTDGEGEYPSYRPSYDAVFVFVEDNPAYITHVPPWAMKMVMDEDQIIEL